MRVLLLNPLYQEPAGKRYERYFVRSGSRWPHSGIKLKGAAAHYLPFPFSLAYAAAYLKKASQEVFVLDAVALNLPRALLLRQIAALDADVVFYELTTLTVDCDLSLAEEIKKISRARIAVGGMHAAYFAQQIIQEHKAIDYVIRGDYEYVLPDLMLKIEQERPGEISGIVHLVGGLIIDNGNPQDKDEFKNLPAPLRGIFPSNSRPDPMVYWDGFCQNRPCLQVQSSRGCASGCSFCLGTKQRQCRQALPEQICNEIQEAVQKYSIREVYFDDDNFTQDMEHVDQIFQALQQSSLRIKWSAMSSFSSLTAQTVQRLAGYGCIGLKLGIESASKPVLRSMHKPVDLKGVSGIIAECRKSGIKTQLTFIIGFLNETASQIKETIAYARSLDADAIQVSIATPFPGTEFFEMAKSAGLLADAGWQSYDGKRTSAIYPFNLKPAMLGKMRKDFLRGWFLRKAASPAWLKAHLPVILRTIKGVGFIFFCKQLAAVFIDENKNS
jgi:anaerobic magnesium-protoporphyrin IX monomethyl ester cyclase